MPPDEFFLFVKIGLVAVTIGAVASASYWLRRAQEIGPLLNSFIEALLRDAEENAQKKREQHG